MTNMILTETATTGAATAGPGDWITLIGLVVFWGVLLYFMFIRPQKKQQKAMMALPCVRMRMPPGPNTFSAGPRLNFISMKSNSSLCALASSLFF